MLLLLDKRNFNSTKCRTITKLQRVSSLKTKSSSLSLAIHSLWFLQDSELLKGCAGDEDCFTGCSDNEQRIAQHMPGRLGRDACPSAISITSLFMKHTSNRSPPHHQGKRIVLLTANICSSLCPLGTLNRQTTSTLVRRIFPSHRRILPLLLPNLIYRFTYFLRHELS